jgi:hypothetical protein
VPLYVVSIPVGREEPTPAASQLSLFLTPLDVAGAAEPSTSSGPAAPAALGAAATSSAPAPARIRLHALEERDAARGAAAASGGTLYERVAEVVGPWSVSHGFAVTAEWQVDDPTHEAAFAESRRQLFEVRRGCLRTFAFDWLLRRTDVTGRYLVLGAYGSEGDLRLCRSHPEIQRFAAAHPPETYTARDVAGMRFYRVERFEVARGRESPARNGGRS